MVTKIIAIDGPAASGKGTIAKNLAEHFDFAHMDTGALYRLVGLKVLQSDGNADNEEDAVSAALNLKENFKSDMTENPDIRTAEAGNSASKVSVFPKVRQALHDLQIEFAHNPPSGQKGAVLDGRDIGTVICPNADIKLFITASTDVRADRRTRELQSKGFDITYDQVFEEMKERDARDSNRNEAPMKAADDAIIIDTSEMSADEAFSCALEKVKSIISKS